MLDLWGALQQMPPSVHLFPVTSTPPILDPQKWRKSTSMLPLLQWAEWTCRWAETNRDPLQSFPHRLAQAFHLHVPEELTGSCIRGCQWCCDCRFVYDEIFHSLFFLQRSFTTQKSYHLHTKAAWGTSAWIESLSMSQSPQRSRVLPASTSARCSEYRTNCHVIASGEWADTTTLCR